MSSESFVTINDDGSGTYNTRGNTASGVPFTPAGTIAATNVQDAIEEVAAEAGSTGVESLAKSGDTPLTGDVTLSAGSNVTLTQAGQDIQIASSGGGGGGSSFLASGAAVDVVSSTTETDLCNFTIPANSLGANGFARMYIGGDFLYNSGGATLSIRVKSGTTTLWGVATAQSTTANRYAYWVEMTFGNKNTATDNALGVIFALGGTDDPPDYGTGALGRFGGATGRGVNNACGIDTTSSWTFKVTGQWSASSANSSIRKAYAYVEYMSIA